jgi:drug/metabolite transporter (DMT)-like permease
MSDPGLATLLPYLLPLLVLIIVVRRSLRERRVRLRTLWIVPAVFAVVTAYALVSAPPPSSIWGLGLVAACGAGAVLGWLRGRHTHLTLDPATGQLTSRATPLAVILFAFIFLARTSLRMALMSNPVAMATSDPRIPLVTDLFLVFALGMLAAQRWEIWRKARQLLAQPRPSAP